MVWGAEEEVETVVPSLSPQTSLGEVRESGQVELALVDPASCTSFKSTQPSLNVQVSFNSRSSSTEGGSGLEEGLQSSNTWGMVRLSGLG